MATPPANSTSLAAQARRVYTDRILDALPAIFKGVDDGARALLALPAESEQVLRRRDALHDYQRHAAGWLQALNTGVRNAAVYGVPATRQGELPRSSGKMPLSLVDDDTIEREIFSSRLALSMMDRAS